jgi:hypothetical protein
MPPGDKGRYRGLTLRVLGRGEPAMGPGKAELGRRDQVLSAVLALAGGKMVLV